MKEWQYTFEPVSKAEWIRQVEADLRQKPLESLQSDWWPDETLMPLIHPEDIGDEIVRLPDELFKEPPRLTEWIRTGTILPSVLNQKIIESLSQGTQAIILEEGPSGEIYHPDWFKDVFREMISISIQPGITSADEFNLKLLHEEANLKIRLERKEGALPLSALIGRKAAAKSNINSLQLVYRFPSSGIWDLEVASTFNQLIKDLGHWTDLKLDVDAFFNQCLLHLEADTSYFKQIIQTRVLHLLWQNLKNIHVTNPKSGGDGYMECHIEPGELELPDRFLIRASMSGLAASVSGTHALCIHHWAVQGNQEFYQRINRNIHHLLSLESGMYKGTDPLAGAYAIDFHAMKWTRSIWDNLALVK